VDVRFLRKRGVELEGKNLLNLDESGNEDRAWDGPLGRDDRMRLECGTPFGFGSGFSFGGWFRQCAAPAIRSKAVTFMRTHFVADIGHIH
jgi:hypothetical protein